MNKPLAKQAISICVICIDPPAIVAGLAFGLQDKQQGLLAGEQVTPQQGHYHFQLDVTQQPNGNPNFTGEYAHGPPKARFLYLTLRATQGPELQIIKRIKITLMPITWAQVQAVLDDANKVLRVKVSGQGAATVPLLDNGWVVIDSAAVG